MTICATGWLSVPRELLSFLEQMACLYYRIRKTPVRAWKRWVQGWKR